MTIVTNVGREVGTALCPCLGEDVLCVAVQWQCREILCLWTQHTCGGPLSLFANFCWVRNEWGGQFFVFHKARGGDRFTLVGTLHGNWSFARPSQRGNAMPLSSYRPPIQVICVPYTHIMQCLDTLLARNHFAGHQGTRPGPMTDVGPRLSRTGNMRAG